MSQRRSLKSRSTGWFWTIVSFVTLSTCKSFHCSKRVRKSKLVYKLNMNHVYFDHKSQVWLVWFKKLSARNKQITLYKILFYCIPTNNSISFCLIENQIQSNFDVTRPEYRKNAMILGFDTEKLLEAGLTGLNTRAGYLMNITFKQFANSHITRRC